MPLNDLACKAALKESIRLGKAIKKADAKGLYLHAQPTGTGYWRYRYRVDDKEKVFSIGVYPETSLAEAREAHAKAHKHVKQKADPMKLRKQAYRDARLDAANTFEVIAREWHTHNLDKWSENHAQTIIRRLEQGIFLTLGKTPIKEITAPILLDALRQIEKRGSFEVARRTLQMAGQISRYAIVTGRLERDVSVDLKRDALKPIKRTNYAAMEAKDLPEFLSKLERNEARLLNQTKMAVELLMLTFVRTSELIKATWDEFDFKEGMWTIPAARMKMRKDHLVPLSKRALEILEELKRLNGHRKYVFPGSTNPGNHMSNNTILMALDRMGYRGIHTGHGFRALAMSTIKEKLGYRHEVIDRQLAHAPGNQVDKAYDRAKFLDDRKVMMQDWADYLGKIS